MRPEWCQIIAKTGLLEIFIIKTPCVIRIIYFMHTLLQNLVIANYSLLLVHHFKSLLYYLL